jgi:sugar phosphate isomerase/epimerase
MKRRGFIKNSIASSAAFVALPNTKNTRQKRTSMEVLIMGTDWGCVGSKDEFCKKIKAAGYDGIEVWWPTKLEDQKLLFEALKKHKLQVGFLCGGSDSNFDLHFNQFKTDLEAATNNEYQKPLYINCHSGKDFFSFEENNKIIALTAAQEQKTGIKIYHETHRGRMCFAAHTTRQFLEKNPKMELTLDISHWTNVHESMLENQKETIELALNRTSHIHARVGHEEGPQVNDPRAPEWKYALDKHLQWWDRVIENKEKAGAKRITFLTEFGPPSYLPTLPFTNLPVANQWEINVYMLNLIRKRYS